MSILPVNRVKYMAIMPIDLLTLLAGVSNLVAGDMVRIDSGTGKFVLADATTAPNARVWGMLLDSATCVNCPVTAIRRGVVSVNGGFAFRNMNFDAPVYLADTQGRISDTPGTVSTVLGRLIPVWPEHGRGPATKMLKVEL